MKFFCSSLSSNRWFRLSNRRTRWLAPTALLGIVIASLSGPASAAIVLDGEEDFTRIAVRGFSQTIDGVFNPGPVLQSNQGSGRNSYTWSMGWYDADADGPGKPALYVGTVRDILCPFGFDLPITEPCLEDPDALFGFDANQRAEIWRYDPSSYPDYGGANGHWTRVYRSPLGGFSDDPLVLAVEALIEADPTAIPPDFQPFVGYLDQLDQVPRDVGYRNQAVCDTYGDSRERLFVTTSGIPGNVLYINDDGSAFEQTSHGGLKVNLARYLPAEFFPDGLDPGAFPILEGLPFDGDIGYRGLSCFNGYLITSPASSVDSGSQDVSENAFLLGNPDPAMQDAAVPDEWVTLVDFRNFPDIDFDRDGDLTNHASDCDNCGLGSATGDPSNYGAFDMTVLGGDLWVAVSNRGNNAGSDRGGVELWRGDGADFGTECLSFDPSIADDGCGGISWTRVIDVGAGRREDSIGPDVDNALGVFGSLNGQLYMALWESGFGGGDGTLAELIRVTPNTPGNETWELLIGGGRQNYAGDPVLNGSVASGVMTCHANSRYDEATNTADPTTGPDCYPRSGRHMGYGAVQATGTDQFDYVDLVDDEVDGPVFVPVNAGTAVYFWRMGTHTATGGDELFLGTLDQDSFLIPEPADGDFISQYLYQYIPPNFGFLCGGDFALLEFWEFLQTADPTLPELLDLIPEFIRILFGIDNEYLEVVTLPDCEVNPTGGLDLVKTTDGNTWSEITTDGFDNPLNYGVRAILSAELPDSSGERVLFIGTANPFTNAPDIPGTESYNGGTEVLIGADTSQSPGLDPVSGILASDASQDRIELSWEAVDDAVSYKIFRSNTDSLDDAVLVATIGNVLSYVDTEAAPEQIQYYWVKAITDTAVTAYGLPEEGFMKSCAFFPITGNAGKVAVICL